MYIQKTIRIFIIFSILIIINFNFKAIARDTNFQNSTQKIKNELLLANSMLNTNPDSSFILYQKLLPYYSKTKDTMNIIMCHIGYSDVYKTWAQYSNSYSHLWDALLLAEKFNAQQKLIKIHMELGSLYNIYDKNNESLDHTIKALNISKKLITKGEFKSNKLESIYFALANHYRKVEQYPKALTYLDSCTLSKKSNNKAEQNTPYIDAEKGSVYLQLNNLDSAEFYLNKANDFFTKKNMHYQVMVNFFLGSLYIKKNETQKAIDSYTKSLEMMKRFNTHTDNRTYVLFRLSEAYEKNNNITLAYYNLKKAYRIADSIFNVKSNSNLQLFQIKNKYQETVKQKDEQIKQQNIVIERNKLIQSRLKIVIGFIIFTTISFSLLLRFKYKLHKLKMEKNQLELKSEFVKEKTEAIMEAKSRELTTSTLQIIEKEHFVEELMDLLKKESPSIHKLMKLKINKGSKDMWEQFNKRFTEVNSNFYDNLRKKHPNLTPTEQKQCALIKLNFNSKEMASLLNISLNSIQVSRHRIRKKLGLSRNDNLSNYISEF